MYSNWSMGGNSLCDLVFSSLIVFIKSENENDDAIYERVKVHFFFFISCYLLFNSNCWLC